MKGYSTSRTAIHMHEADGVKIDFGKGDDDLPSWIAITLMDEGTPGHEVAWYAPLPALRALGEQIMAAVAEMEGA